MSRTVEQDKQDG